MKLYRVFIIAVSFIVLFNCKKEKGAGYSDLIEVLDDAKDAVFDTIKVPQHLRKTVTKISAINIYENGILAKGEQRSANFENFLKLKEIASKDELLSLLDNDNKTVSVYASIALVEKKPKLVDQIFQKFLHVKTKVHTQYGCIVGDQNPAEPLYRKYTSSLTLNEIRDDVMLKKLDSLIIFDQNSPESLLQEAFRYRIYPKNYRKRIEILAFKYHKISAINYLDQWHKGDYSIPLQKELSALIENDTLLSINKTMFLARLLSFKNPANKKVILNEIKRDTISLTDREISSQLEYNGISYDDYH